uniref:PAZ domain-containing protein n=1 Tax=Acrobeloides nanus TaxID=290746 RepID=A0A914C314_9BILA
MASIGEKKVKGVCSLYIIDVKPGSKAYRYDVDIIRTDTNRSLTKGVDDGIRYINKQICLEVMQVAYNITRDFGDPNMAYAYDQRAILFTSKPISIPNGLIQISSNVVSENVRNLTRGSDFNVTITKTVTSHEIDLTDYSQYSQQRPTLKEDRSVRTCLEMILKMDAIQRKEYVSVGLSSLFEVKDKQSVDQGLVLKSGLSQGVRIVENDGSPKAAVVLDVKRSLFYEAQPLIKSIEEVFKKYAQESAKKILNNLYEGVRISVNYTQAARHFPIRQFTNKPIKDIKFTLDSGKEVSIPEYYWNKYRIKLKHVNMPGVIPDVTLAQGKFLVYPSELLTIVANQRVPVEKMSAELSSIVLKVNTVQPEERFRKIDETMKKLRLIHSQNSFLEQFGVSIDPKSNTVEMNVLRKPDISMGGKKVIPDEKTRWRTRDFTYTQGAEIKKWAILYHESRKDLVLNFKGILQEYAKQKGVKLGNPQPLKLSDENNLNEWDKHFKFLAESKAEFVLFIGSKKDGTSSLSEGINYHHRLKLFESLYKVLTQHVASETVDACLNGKRDPRGNIIMMKNGKPLKDTATLETKIWS